MKLILYREPALFNGLDMKYSYILTLLFKRTAIIYSEFNVVTIEGKLIIIEYTFQYNLCNKSTCDTERCDGDPALASDQVMQNETRE